MSFDNAIADGYVKVNSGDVSKFKALEVLVPVKKANEEKSVKTASAVKEAEKPAKAVSAAKPAVKSSKGKKK